MVDCRPSPLLSCLIIPASREEPDCHEVAVVLVPGEHRERVSREKLLMLVVDRVRRERIVAQVCMQLLRHPCDRDRNLKLESMHARAHVPSPHL
jgi:hypothetical protein